MRDLVRLIVLMVADLFRSRAALETEIWMLRQQINVLRRTAPKKQTFSSIDRLIFVCLRARECRKTSDDWRGQDGQSETEQPDHSASLGDSITSSTRIRFSVHTTTPK